jgi:hypothetical protein
VRILDDTVPLGYNRAFKSGSHRNAPEENYEAYLSAEPTEARQNARFPQAYEHGRRTAGPQCQKEPRPEETGRLSLAGQQAHPSYRFSGVRESLPPGGRLQEQTLLRPRFPERPGYGEVGVIGLQESGQCGNPQHGSASAQGDLPYRGCGIPWPRHSSVGPSVFGQRKFRRVAGRVPALVAETWRARLIPEVGSLRRAYG